MSSSPFNLETGFQNIIVRAGAGAGKTTRLVAEVLSVADQFHQKHGRMPRLIVTTFTRKATQELKERLTHQAMQMDRPDLVKFIRNPQTLCLSTIHGVMTQFLLQNGHILGLGQGVRFGSVREQRLLMRKVLRQMVDESSSEESKIIFQNYSVHQLLAALSAYYETWLCGPSQYFSQEDHHRIWIEKIQTVCGVCAKLGQQISTETQQESWTSLGTQLIHLSKALKSSEMDQVPEILETFFETVPMVRYLKNKPAVSWESKESWDLLKEDLQQLAYEEKWNPSCFLSFVQLAQAFQKVADNFCQRFLEKKIQSNQISMSDIEGLSLRILQLDPSAAEKFSTEWDYWFIDEFQDTSPRQIQLIETLRGDRCSFYVGDPQQSIYLFRGSRTEVFLEEEKKIQKSKGLVQTMMTNYRSSPAVLNFINEVFHRIGSQFSKMQVDPAKLQTSTQDSNPDLPPAVQLTMCEDSALEEQAVVQHVLKLLKEGVLAEQIAILTRTNRHLQILARRLEEFQIPVQVHSSGSFYQRREVIDATAFLRFLCQPWNDLNLMILLRSPWMKIADQELVSLAMQSSDSLWSKLQKFAADHPVVISLQKFLIQAQTTGVVDVWISMMDAFQFFHSFSSYDPSGQMEANVWKLIRILKQKERQVGFHIFEILEELQDLSSVDSADGDGDAVPVIEPARVALMTVHASKGLQFRHVILPYLGEGSRVSPRKLWMLDESANKWSLGLLQEENQSAIYSVCMDSHLQMWKQREEEESERVFYVACTRAKESLYGIGSKVRKGSWLEKSGLKIESGLHSMGSSNYLVQQFQPLELQPFSAETKSTEPSTHLRNPMSFPGASKESFDAIVAVTDLVQGMSTETVESVSSEKMLQMFEASHQGIRLHQLFESLKYHPESQVDSDLLPAYRFLQKWENGQILNWIQQGYVEWGFTCSLNQQILQGQIDLWVRTDQNDVWILDYKTGSSHFAQKAFQQLKIYQQALEKLGQLKAVRHVFCAVVFPWEEKVLIRQEQCGE